MTSIPIPDLLARRNAIRAAAQGFPDDLHDEPSHGAWKLEMAILGQPAASAEDLEIKLGLWDELIADPASILDKHRPLWEQLKADWRKVVA